MVPPIWLDATGRPRPTQACWTCGREVAPMRFQASDLRTHGWAPPQTLHIPDWCGCTTEYLPVDWQCHADCEVCVKYGHPTKHSNHTLKTSVTDPGAGRIAP
jgi:hypothetical protein